MPNTCTFAQKMRELYRKGTPFFCALSNSAAQGIMTECGTDYCVIEERIIRFDKIIWIKEVGK